MVDNNNNTNISPVASVEDARKASESMTILSHYRLAHVCFGDKQMETELLQLALSDVRERLPVIAAGVAADEWKSAVHAIKGCVASVGGEKLAWIAAQVEFQGDSPEEQRAPWTELLRETFAEFAQEVEQHIDFCCK